MTSEIALSGALTSAHAAREQLMGGRTTAWAGLAAQAHDHQHGNDVLAVVRLIDELQALRALSAELADLARVPTLAEVTGR